MHRNAIRALALGLTAAALTTTTAPAGEETELLWQFETGAITLAQFITVAPDGTIYTSDNDAVYAVSPDGSLLWSVPDLGGGRPIGLADDGTIYVAPTLFNTTPMIVTALNPDGTVQWEFEQSNPNPFVKVGPNIGPDGNIYAVQNVGTDGTDGLGLIALDPDGELLWSNIGDPPLHSQDSLDNSAFEFSSTQIFMGMKAFSPSGGPIHRSFSYDGDQLWYENDLDLTNIRTYPRLDPQGRLIGSWGQTGIQAVNPDGTMDWMSFHPNGSSDIVMPTIGDDGVIYSGDWLGVELWALDPDGATLWIGADGGGLLNLLTITPDGSTLIAGGSDGFGEPAWVRGYSTADGELLWQIDIPAENGANSIINSFEAGFSPDGTIAYLNVQFAGDVNDYGYLIAVQFEEPIPPADGDVNDSGEVDTEDLLMVLAAWGPCKDCPEDVDGDNAVGTTDLLILLGNWG